jgi:hypothetical protein
MTEWNGIEVGGLYKRTGKGFRDAPLVMVVGIELSCHADRPWKEDGARYGATVNFLEAGALTTARLIYEEGSGIEDWYGKKWRFKAVA